MILFVLLLQVSVGSAESVLVLVGDDVTLPCVLKPNVSALDQVVEWTRLDLGTRSLHFYRNGRDSLQDQNAAYRGRTAMFSEEMKTGNVSVKLSRVRLSDAGQYKCYLPNYHNQETWVTMEVGAASLPVISVSGTRDFGVVLQCESRGWYPQPEVEWLDSEGHVLSAGSQETVDGTDGTFTVRRHVTVERTATNNFTCRVQQQNISQTREAVIHVAEEIFPVSLLKWMIWIFVAGAAFIVAAVISIKFYLREKRNKQIIEQIVAEVKSHRTLVETLESIERDKKEQLDQATAMHSDMEHNLKHLVNSKKKLERIQQLISVTIPLDSKENEELKRIQQLISVTIPLDSKENEELSSLFSTHEIREEIEKTTFLQGKLKAKMSVLYKEIHKAINMTINKQKDCHKTKKEELEGKLHGNKAKLELARRLGEVKEQEGVFELQPLTPWKLSP